MKQGKRNGVTRMAAKRLPWLLFLLIPGMVISSVIGVFENIVAGSTEVVFFQSMILGMAGNAASQSLTETVRTLSCQRLGVALRKAYFLQEVKIGVIEGGVLGAAALLLSGAYLMGVKGKTVQFAAAVSGAVGLSLWCAVIGGASLGSLIPLILQKWGKDPAIAGGPIITTLVDLVSVVLYYTAATQLLQLV